MSRLCVALIFSLLSLQIPSFATEGLESESVESLTTLWSSAGSPQRELIEDELRKRGEEAFGALAKNLVDGSSEQKLLACEILGDQGPDVAPLLAVATDDVDVTVRIAALLALRSTNDASGANAARSRLATTTDPGELNAALAALGSLGNQDDVPLLRTFLGHEDETVRVNAAAALTLVGSAEGEATLLLASHSDCPQARREATYALGLLDSPAAGDRLREILASADGRWKTEAEIALESRQLRSLPTDAARSTALEALSKSENDGVASWARQRIGLDSSNAKHATVVHGGGVSGDANRSLTANAFAVLSSDAFTDTQKSEVAAGAVDEDLGARPINHFYNPVTGRNTMPFHTETALSRADRLWRKTLTTWNRGETVGPNGTYTLLGRTMHLIQDMTSPAHLHDDPHVPIIDSDDFEVYGETQYPVPSAILPGLSPHVPAGTVPLPRGGVVAAASVRGLLQSMAMFTYELTSFEGEIVADTVAQPDSELSRMFPDGRLYYQAGGILGGGYWYIEDVGRYGRVGNNAWWPCAGDYTADFSGPGGTRRIAGRFYIENCGGDHGDLTPAVFERPLKHLGGATGLPLLQVYAGELYPECVSYCAALLHLFESTTSQPVAGSPGCVAAKSTRAPVTSASGDALLWASIVVYFGVSRSRSRSIRNCRAR